MVQVAIVVGVLEDSGRGEDAAGRGERVRT